MCVCVCVCVCVCLCVFCLNGETHTSCRKQRPMTSVRMTYIRTP